jgi:hypothetical protein
MIQTCHVHVDALVDIALLSLLIVDSLWSPATSVVVCSYWKSWYLSGSAEKCLAMLRLTSGDDESGFAFALLAIVVEL